MSIGWRAGLLLLLAVPAAAQVPRAPVVAGCGAPVTNPLYQTHTVFWASEGTAWPTTWVWVTVVNPLPTSQEVTIRLTVDGDLDAFGFPVTRTLTLTLVARQRYGINVNDYLALHGFNMSLQQNFSTEIQFERAGGAALATWARDYSRVFYLPLVPACDIPLFVNPYEVP